MKIPKCKKTITGKHICIDDTWNLLTGETSGSIQYTFPCKFVKCLACELIDDRKKLNNG